MKILMLGDYFIEAIREAFHVMTFGRGKGCDIVINEPFCKIEDILRECRSRGFSPDAIFLFFPAGTISPIVPVLGLEELDIPLVWHPVDAHLHHWWQKYLAPAFDLVLICESKAAVKYYKECGGRNVHWFPLWCRPSVQRKLNLPKLYDVCFVGSLDPRIHKRRIQFLNELSQRIRIYIKQGPFVETFNQSKIVLNQCIADDVNKRVFEALCCGSMLLTEWIEEGLFELFEDRKHLVTYKKGDVDEVCRLVAYYLDHEREREEIALCGREEVLKNHTYEIRSRQFLDIFQRTDFNDSIRERKREYDRVVLGIAKALLLELVYIQDPPFFDPVYKNEASVAILSKEIETLCLKWGRRDELFYSILGQMYAYSTQFEKASKVFIEATKTYPDNDHFHYMLSLCFLNQGKVRKANEEINQAIELEPKEKYFKFKEGIYQACRRPPSLP